MSQQALKTGWRVWLSFALLCLFGASRWLVPESGRSADGVSLSLAAGSLLATAFAWGLVLRQRSQNPPLQVVWRAATSGAMVFAGIALPQSLPTPGATSAEWTIALALSPVVIGVAEPAFGQIQPESLAGRVWPGLASVAGLLLFLPEPTISTVREALSLVAAPVLVGVGAALIGSLQSRSAYVRAAALSGASVVAVLGCLPTLVKAVQVPGSLILPSLSEPGFDGVSLLLSFLVLTRLRAFRWSAIFAVVPLLLAAEGAVLMRPTLGARPLLGMGLLLIAAIFLLLPDAKISAD